VIIEEFNFVYGPPEIVERYTLYPMTVDTLAVQLSVTVCAMGWTPVPVRVIAEGEFVALLVTVAVPGNSPVPDGENVTWRIAVFPGVTTCPMETPPAVYPAPEMLTPEIVILEFPALVNVTLWMLLLPMLTLEKARVVVLGLRRKVAAVTVRVAALLATLPAPFVIVTVNCAPLSDRVVAGVV
jgi:hypothetical protein